VAILSEMQLHDGKVTWLGAVATAVSDDLASQLPIDEGTGLFVRQVAPDSPAAQAGIQVNDVLVKLDDQLLVNPEQFVTLVRNKKDGDAVSITYFRKGQELHSTAHLRTVKADQTSGESNLADLKFFRSMKMDELLNQLNKTGAVPMVVQRAVQAGPGSYDWESTVQAATGNLKEPDKAAVLKAINELTALQKELDRITQTLNAAGAPPSPSATP
jgi:membrane-associated protease RseP (regulator of RpoE activity)